MTTKYYVDTNGVYLGGWDEGNPTAPTSETEVPNPPSSATGEVWINSAWTPSLDCLKSILATYRWEVETAGIVYGGLPIRTDDRSKLLIEGAYAKALDENDPAILKKFKGPAGFVTIDNATLIAVSLEVATHVQKCFEAEADIDGQIDALTVTTDQEVKDAFDTAYAAL